jgi:hypothetical protein
MTKIISKDGKFFEEKELKKSSLKARATNLKHKMEKAKKQSDSWLKDYISYKEQHESLIAILPKEEEKKNE